jgi:tRNA(fMet)-specific endonuclease VapC
VPARFLLDTNLLIHARSSAQGQAIRDRFADYQPDDLAVSVVTVGELAFGVEKSPDKGRSRSRMNALLQLFAVLPLTPEVGMVWGRIRADLMSKGMAIGNNDFWIAAHALAEGLTLVTNNTREFSRIPGLLIEDWTVPG